MTSTKQSNISNNLEQKMQNQENRNNNTNSNIDDSKNNAQQNQNIKTNSNLEQQQQNQGGSFKIFKYIKSLFSKDQETSTQQNQQQQYIKSNYPEAEKMGFLSQEKSGNSLEQFLEEQCKVQMQNYEKVKQEMEFCFDHTFHQEMFKSKLDLNLQRTSSHFHQSSNSQQQIIQEVENEEEQKENSEEKIDSQNNLSQKEMKEFYLKEKSQKTKKSQKQKIVNFTQVFSKKKQSLKKCLKPRKYYLKGKTQEELQIIEQEEKEGQILVKQLQQEKKDRLKKEQEQQEEEKKLKCNKCKQPLPIDLKVLKLDDMICLKCKEEEKIKQQKLKQELQKKGPQRKCRECSQMYALTQENRRFWICEPCRKPPTPPTAESDSSSSQDIDRKENINNKNDINNNNINIMVTSPDNKSLGNSQIINLTNKKQSDDSNSIPACLLDSKIISDKKREQLNSVKDREQLHATLSEKLFVELPDPQDKTADNSYLFVSLDDYYIYIQQHQLIEQEQCTQSKLKEFAGNLLKKYAYNFHDQDKNETNRSRSNTPPVSQDGQILYNDKQKKNREKHISFKKEIDVHIMQYYINIQQGEGEVVNIEEKLISSNIISNFDMNNWALLDL